MAWVALVLSSCYVNGANQEDSGQSGPGRIIEKTIDVSRFDDINISSAFAVEISPSDRYSVTLRFPEAMQEYRVAECRGNELKLGFDHLESGFSSFFSSDKRKMRKMIAKYRPTAVITMPTFKGIELSGASKLTFKGNFKTVEGEIKLSGASAAEGALTARELKIEAGGASFVKMNIDVEEFSANISGASSATLRGLNGAEGEKMEIEVSGASKFDGSNLPFRKVEAEASGASKATVNATEFLEAKASGASKIKYTGHSGLLKDIKTRGASSVTEC